MEVSLESDSVLDNDGLSDNETVASDRVGSDREEEISPVEVSELVMFAV